MIGNRIQGNHRQNNYRQYDNHGFFSLAGIANPTPTIEKLQCQINADYFIPIDNTSIPTGEINL